MSKLNEVILDVMSNSRLSNTEFVKTIHASDSNIKSVALVKSKANAEHGAITVQVRYHNGALRSALGFWPLERQQHAA